MCGIAFTNNPNVDDEQFLKALKLMQHRGPDSSLCVRQFRGMKFGHDRLKILDLSDKSNQPYVLENRYYLIYNGEIYNYKELAKKYDLSLETSSDTEVLLKLYITLGPKMLDEINGMFAFLIYDSQDDELFIARDRLGIKPLYICTQAGRLSCASEISSLLSLVNDCELDDIALRQYRKLRTFFNGRTLYKEIESFPAGHYMLNGKCHKYWDLPEETSKELDRDELKELIEDAVKIRRIADVPVGSYLSGGLDSTVITALAKEPHSWTIGFEELNEFSWARIAAEKFKSLHHEVHIDYQEFIDLAQDMILKRQEPLSVPNEVLIYKMTKAVKKKNTVVLSGEGADELFWGYDRIFRWANECKDDFLRGFDSMYSYGSHRDDEILEEVLAPFMKYDSPSTIVAAFFQKAHLHGLLRRLDNSTMLASVEARVPFVDHRLVELMWGVSFDDRMKNGIVKYPLKENFGELLPREIVTRKKIGFPVPLEKIFAYNDECTPMDSWLDFNLKTLGINS